MFDVGYFPPSTPPHIHAVKRMCRASHRLQAAAVKVFRGDGDHCVMLARSACKVYDRVGPQTFLFLGLVLTVGWIGLLGYGFLALIGY